MKLRTKLGVITALLLGGMVLHPFIKDTDAFKWLGRQQLTVAEALQNAFTLPPDQFSWAKGNRNLFTVFLQDTKDTSILTGTDGYGPWIETPLFSARLVSNLSGIQNIPKVYAAVQIVPQKAIHLTHLSVMASTVPQHPLTIIPPFSPTGFFSEPVFIPIFIYPTGTDNLKIDAIVTVTACQGHTCTTTQVPLTLTLAHQKAYPTPLYAKMMYEAGIFPAPFPLTWNKSLSSRGVLRLVTDTPIEAVHLYTDDPNTKITPLALFKNEARFLVWPLALGRHTFILNVNRHYYRVLAQTDATLDPLTGQAAARLKKPSTPYTVIFLSKTGGAFWAESLLKLSGKARDMMAHRQLKIITLPALNGKTQAFLFTPALPHGLEISPYQSPLKWSKILRGL